MLWKRPTSKSFAIVTGSWSSNTRIEKEIELRTIWPALVMATRMGATIFLFLIVTWGTFYVMTSLALLNNTRF
ncbi:hypothetical protein LINPERHAP1_LOCUS25738 [Linum perenne]